MKKLMTVILGESRTLITIPIVLLGIALLIAPVCAAGFAQTNLVADQSGAALVTDPNLVNAWGIVADEDGVTWIADNHSGLVTTYDLAGTPLAVTFTVPPPGGSTEGFVASPTGLIANSGRGFAVSEEARTGRSYMIVASEDGTISGWNPFVDVTNAILEVDRSASGAVYKGLTMASNRMGTFIYATNFNAGTVDVFNSSWTRVTTFPFADPNIPAGYAPFGIRAIGDTIFVTYALQDEFKHDDVKGAGHGYIDAFTTTGRLIGRFASGGVLNSPWGLVLAPDLTGHGARLGRDMILVGNFGDGRINAFNRRNGAFVTALKDTVGNPIEIHGLWGLASRDELTPTGHVGERAEMDDSIFFTAGPNGEANGLFGVLDPQ